MWPVSGTGDNLKNDWEIVLARERQSSPEEVVKLGKVEAGIHSSLKVVLSSAGAFDLQVRPACFTSRLSL